jgi:pilus assembly protein CpaC
MTQLVSHNRLSSFRRLSAAALLAAAAVCGGPVFAADAPTRPAATSVEQLPLVSIAVGRSTIISSPVPIKRASVTDPKVADLQVVSPTQVLVSGKGVGATDLLLWGPNDEAHNVPISVGVDQASVRAELASLLPGAKIDARLSNNVVVVSGMLGRAEEADSLHRYLDATGIKFVDVTTVPGLRQVQIKVMIAEASRTAIRQLGVNVGFFDGKSFGASNVGLNQFSLVPPTAGGLSPFSDVSPISSVTLFGRAFIGNTALEAFIAAMVENQYMRVLAEPNLVAKSGQEASFLAGGEFPIPVVQAVGTGSTSISIEYKEFGVQLHFRPTVLGENRILLKVAPEVSQLSNGPGSVEVQGFSIPAILTRRAETTLEMNSGQTFAMAGLISQETQARSQKVPGLGDLPVLGPLFRSVRYQQGDTELVLLVTASLVDPESLGANPPIPGMTHVAPTDWELYAGGKLEGAKTTKLSPADKKWMQEAGFNNLRGPGAWATYQSAPAEAQPTPVVMPSK